MARYFNITGGLTQELLAAGTNANVSSISLANVSSSHTSIVDLYIEKKQTGKFYLLKNVDARNDELDRPEKDWAKDKGRSSI